MTLSKAGKDGLDTTGSLFVRLGAVGELLVPCETDGLFGPLGKSEKRVDSNERGGPLTSTFEYTNANYTRGTYPLVAELKTA